MPETSYSGCTPVGVPKHRVKFDSSAESVVAVCTCGRRVLASSKPAAAAIIREHLLATGELADARNNCRPLRLAG